MAVGKLGNGGFSRYLFQSEYQARECDGTGYEGIEMIDKELAMQIGKFFPPCKGTNCGCTDGRSHSAECIAEYEKCTKLPYDEKYLHHPDTGTGWKCYVCGYGGAANNYANTFCGNCHCHR
jgi:hypothetical protein